jgi:hypothetical protein
MEYRVILGGGESQLKGEISTTGMTDFLLKNSSPHRNFDVESHVRIMLSIRIMLSKGIARRIERVKTNLLSLTKK